MERVRSIGRVGLLASLVTLAVGGLMVATAAVVAGDWWLAHQPWIGLGLDLLVLGLALTAAFGVVSVVVEPIGWLRLLAVPPALFVGLLWWAALVFGLPYTGRGVATHGSVHDIGTMLYTLPYAIVIALVATLLILLPLVIARLLGRRRRQLGAH